MLVGGYQRGTAAIRAARNNPQEEYESLRDEGMGVGQALIFVGHKVRLRRLRYQPIELGV